MDDDETDVTPDEIAEMWLNGAPVSVGTYQVTIRAGEYVIPPPSTGSTPHRVTYRKP